VKKILNDPNDFVDESLHGIVLAHADQLKMVNDDPRLLIRKNAPIQGKVAIATGGGYGHLPVFLGYVGEGLADGVCVGNVFSSPSSDAMLAITKAIDAGEGVLFLYGNYFGDKMNFELAQELAGEEGIHVETVRVTDDVASQPAENRKKRRGVAGIFYAYKIAGAAANDGKNLIEVKQAAEKVVENVGTIGVGFTPTTIPASGNQTFTIADDEIEVGIGIHGEPGIQRTSVKPAKELVVDLVNHLIEDLNIQPNDEISVLVNGMGATPLEELYVAYSEVYNYLQEKEIRIYHPYVGNYGTSLDASGFSISFLNLDEELKGYLDASVNSPFFQQR
jgi:phosphoenolpyruvate---glycerone phosphotransferase subunit DhaK